MAKNIKNKRKNQKTKLNSNVVKNLKEIRIKNVKYSFFERLCGFIELGRPIEWSKPLLNMTLAMLITFYVYQLGVNLPLLAIGFFSVAILWSGLYALNDYTDWKIDLIHDVKKFRPIPSGKVTPKQGLLYSLTLVLVSFSIALLIKNNLLVLSLFAMVVNQLLYTTKPFRLKSVKGLDFVSGSMINPFFRYLSGIVLFVPQGILLTNPFPILPVIFVVGIQFSGYSLYRLFSKKHDIATKMKSSVALISEKTVKLLSYFAIVLAVLSYFILFLNYFLLKEKLLGFLPPQYLLALLVSVVFVPKLVGGILTPEKADMKKNYSTLYGATIAFIVANLLIFILIG